ncbi:capsule assembly Wzi family protein [Rivibacter subsaxonicus]|uniref:Capsule assembly protein Wzi n=1 Tax=Rivibacter subsaxonicus TaxID=457575 RepID=A0A4V2FSN0_9BURK|nr:capsule assembly Wzi family protein [Rivibacter subsaxonicus]RZT94895.1 capsule assembly protein Wzi [Rivibacter subsaxonicus]
MPVSSRVDRSSRRARVRVVPCGGGRARTPGLALAAMLGLGGVVPVAAADEVARTPLGPVLLDAGDTALRDDLAWLVDRGRLPDLTLGTWPMPASTVEKALARLELATDAPLAAADADALARVRIALARQRSPVVVGIGINTARRPAIDAESPVRSRAEPELTLQSGDAGWALRLSARGAIDPIDRRESSELTIDGSFAAVEVGPVVAALAAVDRWWGPSPAASPVLGNVAQPVPGLLLRRAGESAPTWAPMAWVGPWTWELSAGRPYEAVPDGSNTLGLRLAARPLKGLELGISRYVYWGGAGRPNSPGSLLRALTGRSNIDDPTSQGPDPSNEIAGFDLRYAFALPSATLVGWAHGVGEDEAGGLPSKYFGTVGLQVGHVMGGQRLQWSLEGTDTRLRGGFGLNYSSDGPAYRHGAFASGHYQRGLPLGSPMGGGGQGASVALDWIRLDDPDALRAQLRIWNAQLARDGAEAINAAHPVPGHWRGAQLRLQGERPSLRWRGDLVWQREQGREDLRSWGVVLRLEWRLGEPR